VTPVRPHPESEDRAGIDDARRPTTPLDPSTATIVVRGRDTLDRALPTSEPPSEADDDAAPPDVELWFG